MLTDEQVADLAEVGKSLDAFVADLPVPGNDVTERAKAEVVLPVDAQGILAQVLNGDKVDDELNSDNELLANAIRRDHLNTAEIRFAAAMTLARWTIRQFNKGNLGVNAESASALRRFRAEGLEETSAVEILAAAILLPDETFTTECYRLNHAAGALAARFDVPLGVVSLRMRVRHCERYASNMAA